MFQFGTDQGTQNRDLLSSVLVPNNQAVLEIGMSEKIWHPLVMCLQDND